MCCCCTEHFNRKKINSTNIEEIWNGDKEKEKLGVEYFGVGDLEVSHNDKLLAYSLDIKGSEYYTIFIRNIITNKIVTKEITNTSGSITFSLDDKYIFYSKLDKNHRARKVFRHEIGKFDGQDDLIFDIIEIRQLFYIRNFLLVDSCYMLL